MKNLLLFCGLLIFGLSVQAQALTVTATTLEPISVADGVAEIQVTATGGTPPYTGTGSRYFPTGLQSITVTDNAGTSSTINYFVCPAGPAITWETAICAGKPATLNANRTTNWAFQFPKGANRYINVPHSSSINLGASFTLEAWVNYSGSDVTIVDKGDYDFLWQLNKSGSGKKVGFSNRNTAWVFSTGTVEENTWTHVAITLSGGTLTFYINGRPSGTAAVNYAQDDQPMNIGRQQPTNCKCNFFTGLMDELRLWNVARTPVQILANMNIPVANNSSGLVAYYQFESNSGMLTDATANGNNGSYNNGISFSGTSWWEWVPAGGYSAPTLSVSSAGTYSIKGGSDYGCLTSMSKLYVPEVVAPTTITASGATILCPGQTVTLAPSLNTNRALSFIQNNDQYVEVPHSASLNLSASFTMEAWVNYSGSDVTIVDKGDYDFLWQLNKTGSGRKMGFQNKNTGPWVYSVGTVPENVWTHVAITLNAGTLTFFINGVPSGNAPVKFTQDNGPMTIGRQQPAYCQCNNFNGTMDELRIWYTVRTPTELLAGMYVPVDKASPGLVAYYKFDEAAGDILVDASLYGNNGTLINNPKRQSPSTSPFIAPSSTVWTPGGATTPAITVATAGTFEATFTNSLGCTDSDSKSVVTSNQPRPVVIRDTTVIVDCYGIRTSLLNLSNFSGDVSTTWNTTEPDLSAVPPGNYEAVAVNGAGCTDTAFVFVKLDLATWQGTLSNEWGNPGNWSTGKVPTALTHVIIPGGTTNPCFVGTADATAASVQVRNGGTLRVINNWKVNVVGKCEALPPN